MNEQQSDELKQLAARHDDLDHRLGQLTTKHYLSEPEQLEEIKLKKQKLQLKDQMEDLRRRQAN
jgi:uncharacterized protein YdcH (DUF465 family)